MPSYDNANGTLLRRKSSIPTNGFSGRVRRNGVPQTKPAAAVRAGDMLTFPQGGRIRVVAVAALGERCGPAVEAARLYDDLAAPTADEAPAPDKGRPPPLGRARCTSDAAES